MRHRLAAAAGAAAGLLILAAGVRAGVAPRETRLELRVRDDAGTLTAVAVLRDERGRPLAGKTVLISRRTSFGWLAVGRIATGGVGAGSIAIPGRTPAVQVRGEFQGTPGLRPSRAEARREAPLPTPLRERPGADALRAFTAQAGLISPTPPRGVVLFLAVVLGGIWGTYAYVGYQLVRVRRP